ncbi:NAD(P)H-dependent oxidoreductase [Rhodoligotrophos defluvii]|uniref:NAD(P)H-dependent oxidoreductase n=1 Tax=Rhodoligotrophos defluvii TaxID=2561934 RepID=UPI0010C99E63|nr:NAD(P)H-dependent oxidoreductase [Rhodoligotrophos defluvii]
MKVLLIHAHYEPKSFTAAMRDQAIDTLTGCGHEVMVSDLYEMQFDPIAKKADFGSPKRADYIVYALEQRHGYETGTLAADIRQEVEKLLEADLLILSFPVFWFSVPAIMKGWIDRVLLSGLAYGGTRFYDRGGLVGKKALVAATIGSREHMFGSDAVHGSFEAMFSHLLRGTLGYVGMSVLPPFAAWHVPYVTDEERRCILSAYHDYLLSVDRLAPLKFPSLADFDDQMRRKISSDCSAAERTGERPALRDAS